MFKHIAVYSTITEVSPFHGIKQNQSLIAEIDLHCRCPIDQDVFTLGAGDVFGWTSLLPPYTAGAGAKTVTDCKLVEFSASELRKKFEADYEFGYLMMTKIAQIIRERLDSIVIETLAYQAGQ